MSKCRVDTWQVDLLLLQVKPCFTVCWWTSASDKLWTDETWTSAEVLVCIKSSCYHGDDERLQSHWSQSCNKDPTDQFFTDEVRERTVSDQMKTTPSLFIVWGCQLWSSFISCSHEINNNCHLHINSIKWSQAACGSSDWPTVLSLTFCPSWRLSSLSSHSFTEETLRPELWSHFTYKGRGLLCMTNHRHGQFDWQQSLIYHNDDQTVL